MHACSDGKSCVPHWPAVIAIANMQPRWRISPFRSFLHATSSVQASELSNRPSLLSNLLCLPVSTSGDSATMPSQCKSHRCSRPLSVEPYASGKSAHLLNSSSSVHSAVHASKNLKALFRPRNLQETPPTSQDRPEDGPAGKLHSPSARARGG